MWSAPAGDAERRSSISAIEITTRIGCRINCSYCPQATLVQAYRRRSSVLVMPWQTYETCLAKIPAAVEIHFLGMSEPWLHPRCTDMVLLAHDRGHRISVSTTLCGLPEKDVDRLRSIPFDAFILHLPGDDDAMQVTVDEAYVNKVRCAAAAGLPNLKYKVFGPLHPALQPWLTQTAEIEWPTMNRANNLALAAAPPQKKIRGRLKCHRIRNNVLLPNGDVVLCCNDYGLRHRLGNLLADRYADLHHSAEFRAVKAGWEDDASDILCRYCGEPCLKII